MTHAGENGAAFTRDVAEGVGKSMLKDVATAFSSLLITNLSCLISTSRLLAKRLQNSSASVDFLRLLLAQATRKAVGIKAIGKEAFATIEDVDDYVCGATLFADENPLSAQFYMKAYQYSCDDDMEKQFFTSEHVKFRDDDVMFVLHVARRTVSCKFQRPLSSNIRKYLASVKAAKLLGVIA